MAGKTPGKEIKEAVIKKTELQKVPTAIPGMDDVLHGGLPAGRTTLVGGGPGSGKSIFGNLSDTKKVIEALRLTGD